MKIIKLKSWNDIPKEYTGIVELTTAENYFWFKNGKVHREDGPAWISKNDYKEWYLDGKGICNSSYKFDLTNRIILSKAQHPLYPTVQVWKILNKSEVYEQIVIPGMEEFIKE